MTASAHFWNSLAMLEATAACVPPAQLVQAVFGLLAAGVLAVASLPADTRRLLLDYGARDPAHDKAQETAKTTDTAATSTNLAPNTKPSLLQRLAASWVAHTQVPHTWFASFYVAYLLCALGWALQWWQWLQSPSPRRAASPFAWIAAHQQAASAPSMSLAQVYVAFVLEALQAARRLYEHVYVFQPSGSKMNLDHWLLGLVFYATASLAVWVDGSEHSYTSASTWPKLVVGTSLFFLAWLGQYCCHAHLASLKKYTLPQRGPFCYLVCPHYTFECLIYFSLAILAAPQSCLVNRTLLSAVGFVVACLGITAGRTKKWYMAKFGGDMVASKWSMIPFIY